MLRGCMCHSEKCKYCNDDECMITLTKVRSLKYPALANDGRIYDAFALQSWLRYQHGAFFVIPGTKITHVKPLSTLDYLKSVWKKIACAYVRRDNHKRAKIDVSTQTDFSLISRRVEVPLLRHNQQRLKRRGLHACLPSKIRRNASSYSAYIHETQVVVMSNNILNNKQNITQVL